MAVRAVIFDWGGTLTPWHTIDHQALWRSVCAPHFPGGDAIADAVMLAESELWGLCDTAQRSATLDDVFARAGVTPTEGFLDGYFRAWDPHTYTDPEVAPVLRGLRDRGIKIGVLSNTMWPRHAHERVFARDEVLTLIDGAVYSSEIPWTKPHPEAFRAAMAAVGETDPASCVFVGDRPYDDIYGAKSVGMRAVLVPHSEVPAFGEAVPDAMISRLADLLAHVDGWRLRSEHRFEMPVVSWVTAHETTGISSSLAAVAKAGKKFPGKSVGDRRGRCSYQRGTAGNRCHCRGATAPGTRQRTVVLATRARAGV